MRRSRSLLRLLLALAVAATPATALETDQYLLWQSQIEDSTDAVNGFLNDAIREALAGVNRRSPELACEKLPPRLYRYLFRDLLSSRIRHFVGHDPSVDRYPRRDEAGSYDYHRVSVFRRPHFPFILPMARTIKLNGVHVGNDKFGHLFGFGRRYYKNYRSALRNGLDSEAAMRRTVERGLRVEKVFVGGWIDGIFSHADLEANFQGLLMARDLCEAEPRHLVRGEAGWELARPVDLRDYINPNFDESYNHNHFLGLRRRQVEQILESEYCDLYRSEPVQALMARYRAMDRKSLSKRLIDEHFSRQRPNPQAAQSLDRICGETPTGTRTAAREGEETR